MFSFFFFSFLPSLPPLGAMQSEGAAQTTDAEVAAYERRAQDELDAARAAELPLVKEIFGMFDADGDGKLGKDEYKAYLRGIGSWGSGIYAPEKWDARWPRECEKMESGTDGIGREAFESILYGKYRAGKAADDLLEKIWYTLSEREQVRLERRLEK